MARVFRHGLRPAWVSLAVALLALGVSERVSRATCQSWFAANDIGFVGGEADEPQSAWFFNYCTVMSLTTNLYVPVSSVIWSASTQAAEFTKSWKCTYDGTTYAYSSTTCAWTPAVPPWDQTCADACATCSGTAANDCLTCYPGEWLTGDISPGTCGTVCDPSCATCDGPLSNDCVACPPGSWLSGAAPNTCVNAPCDPSCQTCWGPSNYECTSCPAGEWIAGRAGEGSCGNVCFGICQTCAGPDENQCLTCPTGTWLTNGICGQVCNSSCNTCNGSATNDCLTCPSGYWLSGASPSSCVQTCDPSCSTCSGPSSTECLTCPAGTWLGANGTCGDVCDPTCATCSGPSNTQCSSCPTGTWLNADGTCGQTCDPTCSTCDGPNNSECLSCPTGEWLPASASSEVPSVVTTLYLTPFDRAQCGANTSPYTPEGSITAVAQADGSVKVTFVTTGGQPNATYIAAETCVQFLGPYTTDANGNGTGTFIIPGAAGQTQAFDTQQTLDGTGNGIVYYTSAQTPVFQLPTGTGDGPCITACDPSCSTCSGPQPSQCTACPTSEWVTNGACGQVCNPSCVTCAGPSSSQCTSCTSGAWVTNGACGQVCDPSCASCSGPTSSNCTSCGVGSWLTNGACGTVCNASCATCAGPGSSQCTSCGTGSWVTNGACGKVCDPSCASCSGPTSSQCTACGTGTWLTNGACGNVCNTSCSTCSGPNANQCSSCATGEWLTNGACGNVCDSSCTTCSGPSSGQCTSCAAGEWLTNGACGRICDPSCASCSGPSSTQCTSCATGEWLTNGACGNVCNSSCASCSGPSSTQCTSCPATEWLTNGACGQICDASCASCSGPSSTQCTSCPATEWLTGGACGQVCDASCASCSGPSSTQCTSCPATEWLTGGACGQVCDASCASCSGPSSTQCTSCNAGSWVTGGACGQVCDASCASCSGPASSQCTACVSTEWLTNGACGNVCDPSCASCSGSVANQCTSCSSGAWLTGGACGNVCDPSCASCSGPASSQCTACVSSEWLTNGACGNVCAAPALVLQGGSSVSGPATLSPLSDDTLTVTHGQTTTLDASLSTAMAGTLWQWVETDSNPVQLTLTGANTPTVSFVAPTVTGLSTYQLSLIASTTPATSVCSNSVESSVVITVAVIPPPPTNCVLSAPSPFGACSASCGGGTQTSTETIVAQPTYGGSACPPTTALTQTQACNTAPCSPCLTNNGGCSQLCADNAGVAQCSCETGYTLGANGTSCYLPPAASAGAAQSICASVGESYALNGTATDPNSPALPMAYLWTEQDSPNVASLTSATSLSASFTAPSFAGTSETLDFALTATDSAGLSSQATTQVTLWPAASSPVPVLGGGSGSNASPTLEPLSGNKLAVLSSQDVVLTAAQAANTTYQWQQVLANSSGALTLTGANTATLSFTSPAAEADDTAGSLSYQFKLISTATPPVGSACTASASSTTVATVVVDEPPVAHAAAASTSVCGGQTITLQGNASTDPNGAALTNFTWTQLANPALPTPIGPLSGESASFTAPTLTTATTLTFALEATDALGLQSINTNNTVSVAVKNVNQAPGADAGSNQTVLAGSSVTLNGAGSFDPDADPLTYSWKQIGGPSVCLGGSLFTCSCATTSTLAAPTFEAPIAALCGNGVTLTFELTVTDQPSSSQCGGPLSSSSTVTVTVEPLDHEPFAFAGFPQTVNDGALVQLNGSASFDPDGDRLTYAWTQLSGPAATLSSNTAVTPTFTAPTVAVGTMATLVFQLTVSDPYGLSASSDVTITDKGAASPPNCSGAYASIGQAWPPSHELLDVSILGVKDPSDPNVPITILSIQQDEPTTATCLGDTPIDGVNNGDGTCLLRGEHGTVTGNRTYYITFQASDPWGNRCTGEVTVCAPGANGGNCAGRGALFDSTR